jgi:tryptophan-rich sensory protein
MYDVHVVCVWRILFACGGVESRLWYYCTMEGEYLLTTFQLNLLCEN